MNQSTTFSTSSAQGLGLRLLLVPLSLGLLAQASAGQAQPLLPLDEGEVVATCHSGYPYNAANPQGYVVALFDARDPASNGAQLDADWAAPYFHNEVAPSTPGDVWNTANLGEVFGIALDGASPPNIYVCATTIYGEFLTSGGSPIGFGPGGPGAVYRLDGTNGDISLCVALPNNGPALGNIAYDEDHDQFFVSNFEDGLIYRINPTACNVIDTYDHGVFGRPNEGLLPLADDPVRSFTPLGRRIWGLENHDGRLYYAVWNEDSGCDPVYVNFDGTRGCPNIASVENEIWSVQIDSTTGALLPATAMREFMTPPLNDGPNGFSDQASNPVSDIDFTTSGKLLLAERVRLKDVGRGLNPQHPGGLWDAHRARVLEYTGVSGNWNASPLNTYRVGWGYTNQNNLSFNSAGGVASDCDENAWCSGDYLHFYHPSLVGRFVYGLQRIPGGGNAGAVTATTTSYLIDLDGNTTGVGSLVHKTQVGDVEIFRGCTCMLVSVADVICPPDAGGPYSVTIDITNQTGKDAEHLSLAPQGPFSVFPSNIDIPTLPDGVTTSVKFTVSGAAPGQEICVLVTLLDEMFEECCNDEIKLTLPECDCLEIVSDFIECDPANPGKYLYTTTFQNLTATTLYHGFLVFPTGVSATPNSFDFSAAPIPPGGTATIQTTICGATPGLKLSIFLSVHDQFLDECCAQEVCVIPPPCDMDPQQDFCLTTMVVPCCPLSLTGAITGTICNTSTQTRTYNWSVNGLPPSSSCNIQLPQANFTPSSGSSGPLAPGQCINISINVDCTPLLTGPQIECAHYRFSVVEQGLPSNAFECDGIVFHNEDIVIKEHPGTGPIRVPIGISTPIQLDLLSLIDLPDPLEYQVHDIEPGGDFDQLAISLDGLPPGEPVVRTVKMPPTITIPDIISVTFPMGTPAGTLENLYVLCDLDRDGVMELACSLILRATLQNPPLSDRAPTAAPGTAPGVQVGVR